VTDVGPGTAKISVGAAPRSSSGQILGESGAELFDLAGRRLAAWSEGSREFSQALRQQRPGTYVLRVREQGSVRSSVHVVP
jgi:hypothetical protein